MMFPFGGSKFLFNRKKIDKDRELRWNIKELMYSNEI